MTAIHKFLEQMPITSPHHNPSREDIAYKQALGKCRDLAIRLALEEAKEKPTTPASLVEELKSYIGKPCQCPYCQIVRRDITNILSRYRPSKTEDIVGEINKAVMFLRDNRPECKECELYPTGKAERWTDCKYCVWSGCFENHFRKYEEGK